MPITAPRLDLAPLSVEALDALIAGDGERLEALTGAHFPRPLAAPPLMEDALPFMRDSLRDNSAAATWGPYLLVLRATGQAIGSAGFTGPPNGDGSVLMGYSVYASFQGQGLASEAAAALVNWALRQPGVRQVHATIPPRHRASQRVAEKAGLCRTDRVVHDPDEGLVEVWERSRS